MSQNHLILLDTIIEKEHAAFKPSATKGEFFEFFSAAQILRDYIVGPEEIEAGIVGQESNKDIKGSDGGIDAMYVMVNGQIVSDLEEAQELDFEEPPRFEVICIQCTRDETFEMARVIRMAESAKEIFDLSRTNFSERFNPKLLEIIEIFRASHNSLLALHISLHVSFHYVTRGDISKLDSGNNDTKRKSDALLNDLPKIIGTIKQGTFEYVGAQELYAYARKASEPISHALECYDSFGGAKGGEAIALVPIGEVYNLITENDELREVLFEWNVRDYQDNTQVNRRIRETLENEHETPFWWLNNGLTILVSKMTPVNSRKIQITGPRIVNGLQTSQEIFRFIKADASKKGDQRLAVVRLIESN
ncbi:MAG: AIPR family protein, partial [Chthoniobacteraceae bacterium]